MAFAEVLACLVEGHADIQKNLLYIHGRQENGRTIALVIRSWRPLLHTQAGIKPKGNWETVTHFKSFEGFELTSHRAPDFRTWFQQRAELRQAGIPLWEDDRSLVALWQRDNSLGVSLRIQGEFRSGKLVDDLVEDPLVLPASSKQRPQLSLLSFDMETDESDNSIIAISIHCDKAQEVHIISQVPLSHTQNSHSLVCHKDEKALIQTFFERIRFLDPDILSGWNILGFDLPRLAERAKHYNIPLLLGRSTEHASFVESKDKKSGLMNIPGRQVLDAMRVMRSSPDSFPDMKLNTVAHIVLQEKKLVELEGKEKLHELMRLYKDVPQEFAEYCYKDSLLSHRILEESGMLSLTIRRSILTGVFLDQAWTSIASFEHWYATALREYKIIEPRTADHLHADRAAGGTVLEPKAGLYEAVVVFDFRSLYPSIIASFGIDPLLHQKAETTKNGICRAPNGALFAKEKGILPAFVSSCFAERLLALEQKDIREAYVLKILLNSLYGVLGARGCRYGKASLAGAITSLGAWFLFFARDWFETRGYKVIYGDTDSVFVASALDKFSSYTHVTRWAEGLLADFHKDCDMHVLKQFGIESMVRLRFDTFYCKLIIQRLRNRINEEDEERGRAKGYAGQILKVDGTKEIQVKGMEAARSDSTPLARRIQVELLDLVFSEKTDELRNYLQKLKIDLFSGKVDRELVYTRRLHRSPSAYLKNLPPPVQAARKAGLEGPRLVVEYIWTRAGPEALGFTEQKPDYQHYLDTQILPLCRSILELLNLDADTIITANTQQDLDLW